MGQFHHRIVVKMGKGLWFLLAAISLSCFALDMMLNRPASYNRDSQVRALNAGARKPEAIKTISGKVDFPAGSRKTETVGKSTPKLPQTPASTPPSFAFEKEKPKLETSLEEPVSDAKTVDMQEIEDRLLGEQIAESMRSPAYLSGVYYESSQPDDFEDAEVILKDENILVSEAIESFEENKLASSEIEEELEDDTGAKVLREARTEEEDLITESGFPVGSYDVNLSEIEDQMLAAQIEESLKNPAYLKALPAKNGTEATDN